jgi:hypothetical protein
MLKKRDCPDTDEAGEGAVAVKTLKENQGWRPAQYYYCNSRNVYDLLEPQ